jgi:putative ABC transport system permease protein
MTSRFNLRPGVRRLLRLPPRDDVAIHADIDAELESLIAARVEQYQSLGMSAADSRAEALRRLGGGASIEQVRDQLHHSAEVRERRMRVHEHVETFVQDIRYAARGLARRPAFTAIAVLTLAIGIGATTSIFSAVNVLLLRSLPFARPEELMEVSMVTPDNGPRKGRDDMVWSYPKFVTFRDAQHAFSDLSLYTLQQYTITSGDVEFIRGEATGATYFRTLGLAPSYGVDFDRGIDAHAGAPRQVIISSAFWMRRFNADPNVMGKTIDLDRQPYTIIGIAPAGFQGLTGQAEIFVPITARPAQDLAEAQSHEFSLVARRRAGITDGQAASEVRILGKVVNDAHPDNYFRGAVWGAAARPLDNTRVTPLVKRSLLVLFGAVGFVLLIACVNVANLLLGRASARRREIAVRLAIGAGRARLVRLMLTESALLAALGGIASIAVAWAGTRALNAINPLTNAQAQRFGGLGAVTMSPMKLDWTALAFTMTVAFAVGVLFGLVPAIHATRASLASAMKDGLTEKHRRTPSARRVLVIAEVALAVVLLAASGLMLRSLGKILAIDPGFDAHNVLTLRLTVPPGGMARDSLPTFYTEMLDRLRAVPGVADASLVNCAPLNGGCNGTKIDLMDRPHVDIPAMPNVGVHWATPTWFSTMRIPLKRGRAFTLSDRKGAPAVVLVNETAARAFWPNGDAIGKRVGVLQGGFDKGAEVIGVVGDVRQNADSAAKPDVYLPYYQSPSPRMMIFLRTQNEPAAVLTDVRRALHDVAPQYPVYDVRTMEARAAAATSQARFSAVLLGLFAATALSLAIVGIYGVMSLVVAARTREIGIRIALGADQHRVRSQVVGEGLTLVSIGAAIGITGALLCTRVLQSLLFDLKPSDPITYVSIVGVLGASAFAASWIPARRAASVDPVVALRTGE